MMVLCCKYYSCLLTILFIGGILSAPTPRNLRCEILSDLYSSNNNDLSDISTKCVKEDLKFPLLKNYCKELFKIQENICNSKFLKSVNGDAPPETFLLSQGLQLEPGEVCGAFEALNGSLYNVYLNEPDFIGKRLSERLTCSLFCYDSRQTECEVLLRTYWIWKVLQEASVPPDSQAPSPPDSQAKQPKMSSEVENEQNDHQNRHINPDSADNRESKPIIKVTAAGNNLAKTTHGTEPLKPEKENIHTVNNVNPSQDKKDQVQIPAQDKKDPTASGDEQSGKPSLGSNNNPTASGDEQNGKSSLGKKNDPTPSGGEQSGKPSLGKKNDSSSLGGEQNRKSSLGKKDGPTTVEGEQNRKSSQDKSVIDLNTASTNDHKHKELSVSNEAMKKPNDEDSKKDDSKLKIGKEDKDDKSKEKSKIDESKKKDITEGKESTSSLATKAGNAGISQENKPGNDGIAQENKPGNDGISQENKPGDDENHQETKDEEISHESEKISKDMSATTVEDTEFESQVNEFGDEEYESQANEFQDGISPNEPENPAADDKTSQNSENSVSDENKSDTKKQSDDTKDSKQTNDAIQFPEEEDSHFFAYFLAIVVLCIAGYLVFHNKQKIIALIIEGRHERRRRPNNGAYKRLDNKDSGKATSHVIF